MAVGWEYPAPYDVYNVLPDKRESTALEFLKPEYNYYAVFRSNDFIAFRCFGADAQVPGGDYSEGALDMGGGLHPDLTGKGLGPEVLAAALKFGYEQFAPSIFRTTVAAFNIRAQRACEKVGYMKTASFFSEKLGRSYIVFTRPAS